MKKLALGFSAILAQYVCLFLLRPLSDLQKIAYEHQSIDKVATDIVFKLRTETFFQCNKSPNITRGV